MTKTERYLIASAVITKLGARRALEATRPIYPPIPNPNGFDGVDKLPSGNYRARIRFCNALDGNDTRVTLGSYKTPDKAGLAYALAHIRLWGSVSRYSQDIPETDLLALIAGGK
jgi:hypothetical protein